MGGKGDGGEGWEERRIMVGGPMIEAAGVMGLSPAVCMQALPSPKPHTIPPVYPVINGNLT